MTQVATETAVIAAAPVGLEAIAADFEGRQGAQERVQLLLEYAKRLPPMPASAKTDANRVMGCTAQVIAGDACAHDDICSPQGTMHPCTAGHPQMGWWHTVLAHI